MSAPVAARVYRDIVSPLVLGGVVRPGRPLGGDAIARLFLQADAVDADLRSRTDLGRVQVARSLVPIDLVPEASAGDWCLFGCVDHWLAAASPELTTIYPRRPSERLLEMMAAALALVAPPKDVLAALSRHTYLSRLFELHRKDVRVSGLARACFSARSRRSVCSPGRRCGASRARPSSASSRRCLSTADTSTRSAGSSSGADVAVVAAHRPRDPHARGAGLQVVARIARPRVDGVRPAPRGPQPAGAAHRRGPPGRRARDAFAPPR